MSIKSLNHNHMIYVLIALGNWDERYKETRHNFGFMLADFISYKLKKGFSRLPFGEYMSFELSEKEDRKRLYIFKGKTYINMSGGTARKFISFLREIAREEKKGESEITKMMVREDVSVSEGKSEEVMDSESDMDSKINVDDMLIFVAHDDSSIPFGRIKISWDGGSGGHKGVLSIIEKIGKENVRIKLGIGAPPQKGELVDYVLSPFSPEERKYIPIILDGTFSAIRTAIEESVEKAMSLYNSINFIEKENL